MSNYSSNSRIHNLQQTKPLFQPKTKTPAEWLCWYELSLAVCLLVTLEFRKSGKPVTITKVPPPDKCLISWRWVEKDFQSGSSYLLPVLSEINQELPSVIIYIHHKSVCTELTLSISMKSSSSFVPSAPLIFSLSSCTERAERALWRTEKYTSETKGQEEGRRRT